MVIAPSITNSANQLASLNKNLTFSNTGSSTALDSFAQQLASEIEGALGNSGNGSQIEINVQSTPGQSSGSSQFTITVSNATAPATIAAAPTVSVPPTTETVPPTVAPATAAATTEASPTAPLDKANMTPTEAYWAGQPPAVQALQFMPDGEKATTAQQLATEGYAIDVPIMVWGWDPLATMIERQTGGYTWIPSELQQNVQEAPGMGMPGATPYDPSTPPPGSIPVTTAFANGTNMQDAVAQLWIQGEAATANSSSTTAG